jgi:glutathione peroxidase
MSIHDLTLTTLRGESRPLSSYAGRALLLVNVASRCGYTPQYKGLEALHRTYGSRGLVVMGVPCNQFGAQEPGTAAEIEQFCTTKYDVTFDMFEKVDVNGPQAHPLFAQLTAASGGPVKWNFTKFLVGRDGVLRQRFEPAVAPDSAELAKAIEAVLA